MSLLGSGSTSSAFLRQLYRQPPRVAHCFSHSSRAALNARGERLVLGIETSCDDSCVSLVRAPLDYGASLAQGKALPEGGEAHVVASVVLRQDHGATGGIEPLQAAHEHAARLPSALLQALEQARYTGDLSSGASQVPSEIDAIAVTQGPGMSGCLSSGLAMAKTLSALWKRPLLYVHHMAAHALTPFLTSPSLRFPYLSLLLSGGHSQLVLVRGLDDYEILADATDGAIGNAFDKVARNLDAIDEWGTKPPGLQLEELAAQGIAHEHWAQVQRARRGLPLDPSVPTPKQVAAQRLRERKTEGREEMLQQRETGVKEDETGQEKNEPKEKGAMEGPKEQEDVELPPPIPPLMRGLPIPFRGVPAFSFGGLKEAACAEIRNAQAQGHYDVRWRCRMAREFQKAAFAQLCDKLHMALEPETVRSRTVPPFARREPETNKSAPRVRISDRRLDLGMPRENIKHLVVAGGVASNRSLRYVLRDALDSMKRKDVHLCFPPIQFCTDNAAMIAHAGLLQWSQRTTDMRRFPRAKWSLADLRVQEHEAAQAEAKAQEAQMEQRVEGRAARALRNLDLGPGLAGAM